MSQTQIIIKNTASQLLSKVITSLIGLVTRKLLTNYLGPAGFGDYVFLLTYAAIFGGIADWGTITISVREASKEIKDRPQIFGSAIVGRLILSIIACLVALLLSPLIIKNTFSLSLVIVSSVLIIVMALKASFGIVFETLQQMHRWVFVDVTASLFTLLLFFVAVTLKLPLFYFFVFLIVATLISCLVGLFLSLKISRLNFKFNTKLLIHLGRESFPMGLALIMFSLYNRIDTVILGLYRTASEVGFYGLAYFIYENIVLVSAFILNSVYPLLSREAKNIQNFKKIYSRYYRSMFGLGLLAFMGTYLLAPFFVRIISSSQFIPSIALLKILSYSLFFAFLNHTTGFSLIALGKQKNYSLITLAALVFNVTANIIFIPYIGATASAWITVGTEATVQLLSLFLITRSFKSLS